MPPLRLPWSGHMDTFPRISWDIASRSSTPTPGTVKGQVTGLGEQAESARGHRMVTGPAEVCSLVNEISDTYRSVVVEALDGVAVDIEREGDLGMAQAVRDDLGMNSRLEGEGRPCMSGVVKGWAFR